MDRLDDQEVDPQGRVEALRDEQHRGAAERHEDDDLIERIDADGNATDAPDGIFVDRRDREHVAYYQDPQGLWKPARLQRGDDVICSGMQLRVVGPARSRDFFLGFNDKWFQESVVPLHVGGVVDRAPINPEEEPLPVVPQQQEPNPNGEEPMYPPLEVLKQQAFTRIDARSDALIASGFMFENIRFSLSLEAQIRYNAMMMLAQGLPYPLGVNSLDDRNILYLQNGQHTQGFCMAALGYVKSVVDSGTIEKDRVRGMEDPEELAGFQDSRQLPSQIPVEPGQEALPEQSQPQQGAQQPAPPPPADEGDDVPDEPPPEEGEGEEEPPAEGEEP